MNFREATFQACDELGDQTSGQRLMKRVTALTGNTPWPTTIYHHRQAWRKLNVKGKGKGKKAVLNDCRTYEGQPRRDMLNDDTFTGRGFNLLRATVKKVGREQLQLLFKEFHSLDQIRLLLSGLEELRKVA